MTTGLNLMFVVSPPFACLSKATDMSRLTFETFLSHAREAHGDKYDYAQVGNSKTKIRIGCPVHGIFEQIPRSHMLGFGCKKCAVVATAEKKRLTAEQFIARSRTAHGETGRASSVRHSIGGADCSVVARKRLKWSWSEGSRPSPLSLGQPATGGTRMFNGRRRPSCDGTSRMTRECHVRICERLGVKFPGPTRHRVGLGARRARPVLPYKQTSSGRPGTSVSCQKQNTCPRCRRDLGSTSRAVYGHQTGITARRTAKRLSNHCNAAIRPRPSKSTPPQRGKQHVLPARMTTVTSRAEDRPRRHPTDCSGTSDGQSRRRCGRRRPVRWAPGRYRQCRQRSA
jgi:hypothetical protein